MGVFRAPEMKQQHDRIAEAAEQMGGIDGLVCAHGYMDGGDGPEPDTTRPAWRKTFQVNVDATANVLAVGLPYLLESGPRSSIVVVGSLVATLGSASSELAYTASKGAVHALVRELAVVHAGVGLRANVVAPGPLAGGLFGIDGGLEEDVRLRRMPMGRRGTAEEVAGAVGFLLSDDASYITGVTLMVDGGASAAFLS
jgi:NAD(P)-dependent dehydrogenase (short-subunit alcohol dehydrogenase family)